MDLFLHACQGLGLALAVGMFAGGIAGTREHAGNVTPALALIGALAGAYLFGWSLTQADADHPAWPGWPVGILAALLGFTVARSIVTGARGRAAEGTVNAAFAFPVVVAGLVLAGLSLLISPISLLALVALLFLWYRRRQREGRKYEGLRVLR